MPQKGNKFGTKREVSCQVHDSVPLLRVEVHDSVPLLGVEVHNSVPLHALSGASFCSDETAK